MRDETYATYDEVLWAYNKLRKRIGGLYHTTTSLVMIQELLRSAEIAFDNELAKLIRRGIVVPPSSLERLHSVKSTGATQGQQEAKR